jgi:uncharacterized YigZ family protein
MTAYPSTIAQTVEHELVIKKSRFIAHVAPVASSEDADAVIAAVKKRAWDARHNCSAQVTGPLGERARSSDDGEPSGTAGVPMLEVLRRRGLTDVVAVVTRYFGGIKLGAGGLVRAYSSAVSEALDGASLVDRRLLTGAEAVVSHADAGRFDNLLREWAQSRGAVLDPPDYGRRAAFTLWVAPEDLGPLTETVAAASAGAVRVTETGEERLLEVPRS